ncbi:MAG TPA: DUF2339 domain-containing protein [Stellaceae bacterium]|nr:DUF2339 domain-containing protein [Stellaceae bacterium]
MDWDDAFPWVAAAVAAALGMALKAIIDAASLHRRVEVLADKMRLLDHRVLRLAEGLQSLAPPPPEAGPAEAASPAAEPTPAPAEPVPPPVEAPAPAPEEPAAAPPPPAPQVPPGKRWEQVLAENWLVWLGGVALALGGAFLVKLSIDYGLLVPAVRVVLAALLGIGLCIAGDRLARRELQREPERPGPSYVPQALAAAGAAIVFASICAAYQLYGLIPSALAFPLLAATAIATVAMSLRLGPFVAALGLLGAYIVPLLVNSEDPHALSLFGYLAVITAAALALLRHRAWWWLAWLSLTAVVLWVMLWLGFADHLEAPVVAGFLLVQVGLFAAFRRGIDRIGFLAGLADTAIVRVVTRSAFWALAFSIFLFVHADDFGEAGLVCAFAAAAFLLWFAWADEALDDVLAVAGALLLAVLASWELSFPAKDIDLMAYTRAPAAIWHFMTAAVASAALLAGVGFLALRHVARPGRWAALSAAAPVLVLLIVYWRLHGFALDIGWSGLALILAGIELAAAAAVARRRSGETEIEIALAAYAVGVLAGTILAATFALSTAWLTVALALHLPALGWVEGRIRVPVLRWLALGVAAAVLARLALNPYVLSYPLSPNPIFNWLLYGYGVPALAFIVATRQFGSRADDLLVAVLEGGSIVFTTLLLTLELRHALYGRLDAPLSDLGRDAAQTVLWLALAAFALWLGERRNRPVLLWGGVILFAGATAQAVLWQALAGNPLWTGASVGQPMIVDTVGLAFGLPAVLYAAVAWLRLGPIALRWTARILAVAFAFLWLTLEIRHAFRGPVIAWGTCSQGEWYAYSAAWLAFAGAGLGIGLWRRDEWLRRAALAGIGLVVAKVFLSDMAELEGVLRALSFLGLGGVLVGIGYAYRRLRPLQA